MQTENTEYARLPKLSEETGLPLSWLYEKSRFGRLPGQCRAGKYVLIHRPTFFEALKRGDLALKETVAA